VVLTFVRSSYSTSKSPVYPGKSPANPQNSPAYLHKSPVYAQIVSANQPCISAKKPYIHAHTRSHHATHQKQTRKSPFYPRICHVYPQKRPVHLQKSPTDISLVLAFQREPSARGLLGGYAGRFSISTEIQMHLAFSQKYTRISSALQMHFFCTYKCISFAFPKKYQRTQNTYWSPLAHFFGGQKSHTSAKMS